MIKRIFIGAAVLLVLLVAFVLFAVLTSDPVERCLDHGGSWHYDREICDFEVNYTGPRP